ncbi:MAG TPA: hypothetical protein VNS52_19430 [Gemmatimonadaceae bacterium]|nr:hypothetical protein [Gemmatimonadaceae bacterium]
MRRRRARARRAPLLVVAALLLVAAAPTRVLAQPERARSARARWVVTRDAFADLWYHGLAVIGADGYGPLSLYAAAYRADVRTVKHRRGSVTRLDDAAAELRAELRADSAYEVLHFVPAYFVGEDPVAVLAALRRALTAGVAARPGSGALDTRAAAVAGALPTARERRSLLALVDLLDDEWRAFVRDDRAGRAPDAISVARLQDEWDRTFAPPLAGWLDVVGRGRGGVIVVVPAVGAEGRIVAGAGTRRAVVVVTADVRSAGPTGPLLAAVRELAFPLLDALPSASVASAWGDGADRVAASRARDVAAVRGGALLLEGTAPALAARYRRFYLEAAPPGPAAQPSFEQAYPLDARAERALRSAASRFAAPPTAMPRPAHTER